MSIRLAVKAAQSVLQTSTPALAVDGVWGQKSEAAFVSAPMNVRADATKAVEANGYALNAIRKVMDVSGLISPAEMSNILVRVQAQTGIDTAVMQKFVDLEAARKVSGGVRYYVPNAVNPGGYRGLFQFDRAGAAWASASKMGPLPPFNDGWKDPYANSLAAAYYLKFNSKQLRSRGYKGEITGSMAYLMHNQGAAGAFALMIGGKKVEGDQSPAALAVIAQAVDDYRNGSRA